MSKQCLDIEQMQHLHELDLDTSKASMHYWIIRNGEYSKEVGGYVFSEEPSYVSLNLHPYEFMNDAAIRQVEDVPTFTLQDILDILPRDITKEGCNWSASLYIDYENNRILYGSADRDGFEIYHEIYICDNVIDAAYEMLCWCIEKARQINIKLWT